MKRLSKQNTVNIKAMPLQARLGASKYINNDWGTVAFFIPREVLRLNFDDEELQYNCIYLLLGNNGISWSVYVGQAKKRNGGGSVLKRLREHDGSVTEAYGDKWNYAVVFTNKEDVWGVEDLNALKYLIYEEIQLDRKFNGNTPNCSGVNFEEYADKVKQIKSYIALLGIDIFEKSEDIEEIKVTSEINKSSPVEDLQNGLARIPEIVTPQRVVKEMVDSLHKEVWNSQTTFLDLACKGGEYLREIYNRLMETESLQVEFPNEIARALHILDKQLYGIALSNVSLERTVNSLNGYDKNIKVISNYVDILRDKDSSLLVDTIRKELNQVRFDVVIGNPPYQQSTGSGLNGSGGKPLFDAFITNGIKIASREVCMITPTKWMSGNQQNYVDLRKKLTQGNHIKYMVDFFNPTSIFPGTQIAGGVSYFLYDKQYNGKVRFIHNIKTEVEIQSDDERCFNTDGIIPRHAVGEYIIEKISKLNKTGWLSRHVYKDLWKLPTNFDDGNVVRTSCDELRVITPNCIYYIDRDDVKDIDLDCYKVIFTRVVNGSTFLVDSKKSILSSIEVLGPGEICNASYMLVGDLSRREYAENVEKYLKTKFVRFLILQTLFGIGLTADRFQFVPTQDFTENSDIDWSTEISDIDKQLYEKYGIIEEEIRFIDSVIKEMK